MADTRKPKFNMELSQSDQENIAKAVSVFGDTQAGSVRRSLRLVGMLCDMIKNGWEIQVVKKGERPKTIMLL